MRLAYAALLASLLLLQGCFIFPGNRHGHDCLSHPEPPFILPEGGPPGPALVFGTADFDDNGAVLIKLQVEDLSVYAGDEAEITAWGGNGEAPATASDVPPPGGKKIYDSGDDVHLRHWTTHIDRNYDEEIGKYWVFVRVDHNVGGGNREVRFLWWRWIAGSSNELDTPHDFHQY